MGRNLPKNKIRGTGTQEWLRVQHMSPKLPLSPSTPPVELCCREEVMSVLHACDCII